MPLVLYNSLIKGEEPFVSLEPKKVKMYTCGPTVYGRPHIGNYSSFLMADLLRRWLEVSGYEVTQAKNITDVGHLLHDADQGDDKVEKEARRIAAENGRSEPTMDDVMAVAREYERQYLEDEQALHFLEPASRPHATDYIKEMITIIEILLDRGHAYETDDGIYFSVETFPAYGKLSGNALDNLNAGARVEVKEQKKHPADFALWKKATGENAKHILHWSSPWGEGFPGWHIECSAMSRSLLGNQLDIHTGGEDNIFPHHECEIAQSECSDGKPFSRFWLHKRRIDMGAEKMSKSLGNVLTLPDVIAKGFNPLDLRYYLLAVHYRTRLKFTWRGLEDAKKERQKTLEWMQAVESDNDASGKDDGTAMNAIGSFHAAMNEDLNVPAARAAIFSLMNFYYAHGPFGEKELNDCREFIRIVRYTFGCFDVAEESIPADVLELVAQRQRARAEKNFSASDQLRDAIHSRGYDVRDTSDGQMLRRRSA